MNSRGERTQARAASRRLANIRRQVAEKLRRDQRAEEKKRSAGGR